MLGYKMLVRLSLLNNRITFYFFIFVPFIGTCLQPLDVVSLNLWKLGCFLTYHQV